MAPGVTRAPRPSLSTLTIARELRRDPLALLERVTAECGDIGAFRLGPRRMVLLNSPALVREIYVEHPEDFDRSSYQRRALTPLLGRGLLTSEGALHARQRQMIAPAFHARHIAPWAERMAEIAHRLQAEWPAGAEIDLLSEMNRLTMSIVGQLLLSSGVLREGDLGRAVTTAFAWEMYALTRPLPLPLSVPTPRSLRTRRALHTIRSQLGTIIERRLTSGQRPDDLLSLLLDVRDETDAAMEPRQLYDEIVTLCGAAQETSADAITWALYLLGRHPDVARQVRDEVDAVLGERVLTHADLPELPRSLAVFKETLRLYPPASVILRGALRDTTLGGYRVRRGTIALVSPYLLHRREAVFPDPERFDPNRFTRENERALPKFAFLPFGAGHHVCVGGGLSLMEGQVLVATLAQRSQLEFADATVAHELVVNLRPAAPIRVRVHRRSAQTVAG
ncbi:cytochrome P450 [Solirubrobacter taibaiensis]|nr:cytochrome P450 [Solirubrobacter taibaiensis]